MATTHTDTNVNQLVINKLTKQEYNNLSQVSENELWLVEESIDDTPTENSTNPVQSGAVYEALQDIEGNINDGTTIFAKNQEIIGTTSANQSENKTISLPSDVIMCKMSDGLVYDSYTTYTKVKQYLPDYPYYSDNLNWEIDGNPPMRASITEGDYYLDVDTNHIFVADENLELVDVTSSVVIQGDTNKLYCDVDTNMLYRYDGTDFVALTSEGKTYTLSSNNENIRLTDNDGQTQDVSLSTLINGLSIGNSDPQDDDYIISQHVNGGTTTTTYHRRPLSKFWNWIKTKLGIGTNDGTFLRKDGTWVTPTDTKATVTTTGSGNAITSLTASNGALTATKGSTFLTSHQDISGKVNKSGDTMSGNLTTPALKISGGRTQNSGDDEGLVIAPCSDNSHAALTLAAGGDPQTAAGKYHSTFYLQATGSYNMFWRASVNGTVYDIQHPKKSGTIALTSDIQQNTWRPIGTGATDAAAGNHSHSAATQSAAGFMSAADKKKLDGIASGATANSGTVTSVKVGNTSYNPSSGVVSLPNYPSEPTSGGITISKYSTASTLTINAYSCSYYGRTVSGYIQFTTSSTINAGNNLFLLSTKTSAQNICFIVSTDNGSDIRILKVVGNSGTIQNVPALPSGKTFYGHFSFITT